MDADVSTLLHIHDTSQQFESKRNGVTIGLIAASTVLILFILYYITQAYLWDVVKSCAVKRENTESESIQKSQCKCPPFAI
jgi:predicted transcriptional regulator